MADGLEIFGAHLIARGTIMLNYDKGLLKNNLQTSADKNN